MAAEKVLRKRRGMRLLRRRRLMVNLSAFFMKQARSQKRWAISRNQNQKRKGKNCNLCAVKQNPTVRVGIDNLSDDLLIKILSCMNIKEAKRTSVLARRWKSLWSFVFGTLQFDFSFDYSAPIEDNDEFDAWEKFVAGVNRVLELHQGGHIEGMVFSVSGRTPCECCAVDGWVYFAVQKEVERFELHRSYNDEKEFPSIEMLTSHSPSPFRCLRTLKLVRVDIKDEVVNYFLTSCPDLEELCIVCSYVTLNLLVVDPPSLRVLEISECMFMQSLELSADSLVSLVYGQNDKSGKGLVLKKVPNIRELTIIEEVFVSFFSEPEKHSSCTDQLVKLVVDIHRMSLVPALVAPPVLPRLCSLRELEVKVFTEVGRGLLFFMLLIEASPQLCKFRIELVTLPTIFNLGLNHFLFPAISGATAVKFNHKRLKVVEMAGYVGCSSEEELLRSLVKNAPLIERVVIDTKSEFYDHSSVAYEFSYIRKLPYYPSLTGGPTRDHSKHHAQRLVSTLPQRIQFIIT